MATGSEAIPGVGRSRHLRPRWTLRLRLTLLYGVVFLMAGAVLLAITYGLVVRSASVSVAVPVPKGLLTPRLRSQTLVLPPLPTPAKGESLIYSTQAGPPGFTVRLQTYRGKVNAIFQKITAADEARVRQLAASAKADLGQQRTAQKAALLTKSGIALAIMAVLSIGLGWLMAGRALRPVRTMSARARGISERNLHERLALDGPDDELKELGDTFDGLLGRLETAFESQRRFVANASHELRTPMTLARTLIEVAIADPHPSVSSLRDTCRRVLAAGEQQERLIESLLTLARSQRGLDAREPLDLGAVAGEVLRGIPPNGVQIQSELEEANTTGDPALVERLVANLVDNALAYNEPHGWVKTWTGVRDGRATLRIINSGLVIPADQADALLEPFRRLNGSDRTEHKRGLGLGLSIVSAIATAHGAELSAAPRPGGGLDVKVSFPP